MRQSNRRAVMPLLFFGFSCVGASLGYGQEVAYGPDLQQPDTTAVDYLQARSRSAREKQVALSASPSFSRFEIAGFASEDLWPEPSRDPLRFPENGRATDFSFAIGGALLGCIVVANAVGHSGGCPAGALIGFFAGLGIGSTL